MKKNRYIVRPVPRVIRYLVRSTINSENVYCTDGEFHASALCGPGGFCAKLYKTRRGAENVRMVAGAITVHTCDQYGVES